MVANFGCRPVGLVRLVGLVATDATRPAAAATAATGRAKDRRHDKRPLRVFVELNWIFLRSSYGLKTVNQTEKGAQNTFILANLIDLRLLWAQLASSGEHSTRSRWLLDLPGAIMQANYNCLRDCHCCSCSCIWRCCCCCCWGRIIQAQQAAIVAMLAGWLSSNQKASAVEISAAPSDKDEPQGGAPRPEGFTVAATQLQQQPQRIKSARWGGAGGSCIAPKPADESRRGRCLRAERPLACYCYFKFQNSNSRLARRPGRWL